MSLLPPRLRQYNSGIPIKFDQIYHNYKNMINGITYSHTPLSKKHIQFLLAVTLIALILSACQAANSKSNSTVFAMASMEPMPAEVKSAPVTVQQAYQFAAANPEILQKIPCYCGCGNMGHKSNYDCYISGSNPDGSLTFDTHALGCSICVDITQDTMRLHKEGTSVMEIKAYVDQTYAKYGQSNMP
jgi:hypothetical protein